MIAGGRPPAPPGPPWLKLTIVALFIGAMIAFFAFGGQHYLSLETIKANRDALLSFADRNFIAALAIAFVVYAGATALSLPGGLVLSLAMGFIFGRWVGTVLVVVAATVGATLVFLAARYLFADCAQATRWRRRADQCRLHRECLHLPAVPSPGSGVSVLPRQPGTGVHRDPGYAPMSSPR